MDYSQHNTEQAAVWAAFYAGTPVRVPMALSFNERIYLQDPTLNTRGITFQDFYSHPSVMFDVQLEHQFWARHHIPFDGEMGLPETWWLCPNFMNFHETAWLGGALHYLADEIPDTRPFLNDDNKRMLFDAGIPDPFAGIYGVAREFHTAFQAMAEGRTFHDRPISITAGGAGLATDGPVTMACNLRGATEFCLDIYEDAEYAEELLAFLTEAALVRQRAWREYLGIPALRESLWIADDSIALLSCDTYKALVLPFHKKLVFTDSIEHPNLTVHLCGDSTRHFATMVDELGARCFDTGYPVDFGAMRKILGPEITLMGGPQVELLLHGTPEQISAETTRILHSGVMEGGKFILKEGNNLAPCTPFANLQAMYDTCKWEGRY